MATKKDKEVTQEKADQLRAAAGEAGPIGGEVPAELVPESNKTIVSPEEVRQASLRQASLRQASLRQASLRQASLEMAADVAAYDKAKAAGEQGNRPFRELLAEIKEQRPQQPAGAEQWPGVMAQLEAFVGSERAVVAGRLLRQAIPPYALPGLTDEGLVPALDYVFDGNRLEVYWKQAGSRHLMFALLKEPEVIPVPTES